MYRLTAPVPLPAEAGAVYAGAEAFFANTAATVLHGGDRAFYSPGPDIIRLPERSVFVDAESYVATKAHELIHWTTRPSRLNRCFESKGFGSEGYAKEELVAEIGAAFLCVHLGVTPEPRADHAAYLASWLRALRNDKRLIFSAAAHAQCAVDSCTSCRFARAQQQPRPRLEANRFIRLSSLRCRRVGGRRDPLQKLVSTGIGDWLAREAQIHRSHLAAFHVIAQRLVPDWIADKSGGQGGRKVDSSAKLILSRRL